MIIGAVNGALITAKTPLDPHQWRGGKPWTPTGICRIGDGVHFFARESDGIYVCQKCGEV